MWKATVSPTEFLEDALLRLQPARFALGEFLDVALQRAVADAELPGPVGGRTRVDL